MGDVILRPKGERRAERAFVPVTSDMNDCRISAGRVQIHEGAMERNRSDTLEGLCVLLDSSIESVIETPWKRESGDFETQGPFPAERGSPREFFFDRVDREA